MRMQGTLRENQLLRLYGVSAEDASFQKSTNAESIQVRLISAQAATAGHWEIKKDEEMIKIDLAVTYATTLMALKLKCTTTDDGYQFHDKLEMSFVERPELFTPPPDEGTFGENFRLTDILGSHDTSDITTLPIRRIFDRFRNLLTDNIERDFVSHTSLGKRPPSTTSFPHAYAEGGGAPPATNQTISIDRNIRRRLTKTPSHNTVDATALLAPSKLHVHTELRKPGVNVTYLQNIQVIIPKLHNMKICALKDLCQEMRGYLFSLREALSVDNGICIKVKRKERTMRCLMGFVFEFEVKVEKECRGDVGSRGEGHKWYDYLLSFGTSMSLEGYFCKQLQYVVDSNEKKVEVAHGPVDDNLKSC
ncbi:hypothetical protein Tco_0576319 [Tanacetum coccineum]